MKRFVIIHKEGGIYVGHGLGLAFFSLHETAGQHQSAVFENEEQAGQHIVDWEGEHDLSEYSFHEVETEQDMYATCDEMEEAGLGHLLGDMRGNEPEEEDDLVPLTTLPGF